MSDKLELYFPNLKNSKYTITSSTTRDYNCIAFAAGEIHRWWWPIGLAYWPENAPRSETVPSFVFAFGTFGYSACEDGTPESGFEKLAIYAHDDGIPTHMARQLPSGIWVSKCGGLEDIEHETLEALVGPPKAYGSVVQFLKRTLVR